MKRPGARFRAQPTLLLYYSDKVAAGGLAWPVVLGRGCGAQTREVFPRGASVIRDSSRAQRSLRGNSPDRRAATAAQAGQRERNATISRHGSLPPRTGRAGCWDCGAGRPAGAQRRDARQAIAWRQMLRPRYVALRSRWSDKLPCDQRRAGVTSRSRTSRLCHSRARLWRARGIPSSAGAAGRGAARRGSARPGIPPSGSRNGMKWSRVRPRRGVPANRGRPTPAFAGRSRWR